MNQLLHGKATLTQTMLIQHIYLTCGTNNWITAIKLLGHCWIAQLFWYLAVKPEVGSSIPHSVFLTGAGVAFTPCYAKQVMYYSYTRQMWWRGGAEREVKRRSLRGAVKSQTRGESKVSQE